MSLVKFNSMSVLIEEVSREKNIPIEAAEDLVEHVQELLYEHREGMGDYTSEEELLLNFGINPGLLWVFD